LEVEVEGLRALRRRMAPANGTAREKALVDRYIARLLQLLAPRVRHFTRAYGLLDVAEDARQACAIGVMRAVEMYDPAKASFTTLVTWQLRGELQSLRYRLRPDWRESARAVGAQTISLDGLDAGLAARRIEDGEAIERAEALASEVLARRACGRLLDEHLTEARIRSLEQMERRAAPRGKEWVKPGTADPASIAKLETDLREERAIVLAHLLGSDDEPCHDRLTAEQRRQIARRTIRALGKIARGNPRYDPSAPTRH
jgi:RNA polymerase sigma-32 factor